MVGALDPSIDTASRNALDSAYKSELRQITSIVQNATFDGANLLNGSVAQIKFIANADATGTITLSSQTLNLGSTIITIPATSSITSVATASIALAQLSASILNTNQALGNLGSQAKEISNHNLFVQKLSDQLQTGNRQPRRRRPGAGKAPACSPCRCSESNSAPRRCRSPAR